MKAAILTELNAPLTLANVEPGSLSYGQVLVRVIASGICGAQLQEIRGEKGGPLPHLLGHEGCGVVEQTGPGVTRMTVGQRVVMHWRKAGGVESDFPRYRYGRRDITSGKVVTFAEKAICSENRLTPVPDDTPTELCALLGCGLSTALGVVERDAAILFGESVLIIGCGGLGMNLILACGMRTASPIVVADVNDAKVMLAKLVGADQFLTVRDGKFDSGAQRFDVILDTAGDPRTMAHALPLLAPSGRYIMIGQPAPRNAVRIENARHMFDGEGKTIRATQGGGFSPDVDIPRYVGLWRAGMLNLTHTITHWFPLDGINEGIDLVRAGDAGRVLIEMS